MKKGSNQTLASSKSAKSSKKLRTDRVNPEQDAMGKKETSNTEDKDAKKVTNDDEKAKNTNKKDNNKNINKVKSSTTKGSVSISATEKPDGKGKKKGQNKSEKDMTTDAVESHKDGKKTVDVNKEMNDKKKVGGTLKKKNKDELEKEEQLEAAPLDGENPPKHTKDRRKSDGKYLKGERKREISLEQKASSRYGSNLSLQNNSKLSMEGNELDSSSYHEGKLSKRKKRVTMGSTEYYDDDLAAEKQEKALLEALMTTNNVVRNVPFRPAGFVKHASRHKRQKQRTWVTEMRGYNSEPSLPLPFDKKFKRRAVSVQQPYMKPLGRKWLSMDDVFLSRDHYPSLVRSEDPGENYNDFAVRDEMLKSWDELFKLERLRFSFHDELFAKGCVVDSLEIPGDPTDRSYLVAAEEVDLRTDFEFGRAVMKTKNIYTGEFKDKYFEGMGRYQWLDGTVYLGHFKKGIMDGHGQIEWDDGSLFEGKFTVGHREGYGIYTNSQGYTYTGNWLNGTPHGLGKMWYDMDQDQYDYYDGNWEEGLQQGLGVRQYSNGDRYIGNFAKGSRNGKGTMIWLNERQVYKGNWLNGVPHGYGTHIWYLKRTHSSMYPARHIYKGQWFDGMRHGIGKMIYPCGSTYEGRWKDGQRFGRGMFVNPAGELLVGLFRAGNISGGTEIPLHAPPYECDYASLVEWLNNYFHLDEVENVDQQLYSLTVKHIVLFRKLFKRAGQLGQSWGNNGLYPSWLKMGPQEDEEVSTNKDGRENSIEEPPHMRSRDTKPLSPDNVYPVTRFGLWLLIKDISGLLDNHTMAKYDSLWSKCAAISFQTLHHPFEPVHLWQFLKCLIIVAVAYYVDGPNRKYQLKWKFTRKRKVAEVFENVVHSVSTVTTPSTTKDEIVDDCSKFVDENEEYRDETEEDDGKASSSGISSTGSWMLDKDVIVEEKAEVVEEIEKTYDDTEDVDDLLEMEEDIEEEEESDDSFGRESSSDSEEEDEIPITIFEAFEKLIKEKLTKVIKRPPGKHLPSVPDPLPSLTDLYISFKSLNNTDFITGAEFIQSVVPHAVFPNPQDSLYWHRCSENLSSRVDLDSLKDTFEHVFDDQTDSKEETMGDEFLGTIISYAEVFSASLRNEMEPTLERMHQTTVEILQQDRKNLVFNINEEGRNSKDITINHDDAPLSHKFVLNPESTKFKSFDGGFAESNPFSEEDLTNVPFLYTQTRTCTPTAKIQMDPKWLSANDVTKVFKKMYPKLAGGKHCSNIPSKLLFCDWLWCTSLCAKASADKEFYANVMKDPQPMRPRLFHTTPRIGIHSPTEITDKWRSQSAKIGNSLYYIGDKKELHHIK